MRKVKKGLDAFFYVICLACSLLPLFPNMASAAAPVVSNVMASQRTGTKLVDITYDVADADGDNLTIAVQVSNDGGVTYNVPATHFSGDYGAGVKPGTGKKIVWDAGADWNQQYSQTMRFRITPYDSTGGAAPAGMVLIPAGSFQMGDPFSEGDGDERPVHTVTLSAFYIDRYEITKARWDEVYTWALTRGYSFTRAGSGTETNHPVQSIDWYDAVKWLNALSEKEGRTPVYYTDSSQTYPYRGGILNIANDAVKWTANGYRLPTEAEWEKACRGGVAGTHYPWPNAVNINDDWINASMANYDKNKGSTTPVGYYNGQQTPQGKDMANGYGLYDMAGNVAELVWDYYDSYSSEATTDPRGPVSSSFRVFRGGHGDNAASFLRCGSRDFGLPSNYPYSKTIDYPYTGFRSAISYP